MGISHGIKKRWIVAALFIVFFVQLFIRASQDIESSDMLREDIYSAVVRLGIKHSNPFMLYVSGEWNNEKGGARIWKMFYDDMPLEKCMLKATQDNFFVTEYMQEYSGGSQESINEDMSETILIEEAVIAENTAAKNTFIPVKSPVALYSRQQLRMPGFIKETFYSEDATTYISNEQLDYDTLMNYDAALKQDNSNIQILVYHTHSQEAYIDSIPGDTSTSIVGVGEALCDILRTKYGFNVLHHTGEYDVESRDYAYSNAMKGLEQVLNDNPSIEVMIDLHRDETNADTRLITTVQDKTMAKFMFFNGLCYTRELGKLENLPNPYVQDNLSFAFQLQLAAEEYYPGLTRRIYLKGYRYNLHYRPKSLLIELGSQTNTVEEAKNSCEPLAHIISMVLNGENKENKE